MEHKSKSVKRKGLTDDEIRNIAETELQNAIGLNTSSSNSNRRDSSSLSKQRADAMDRYLGEPRGDEQEGRSRVQGRDVLDTIEWILPKLIKMFTMQNASVEIEPVSADDEQQAAQETDVINHIFFKKNNGFLLLYTWFKDALLQKTGIIKRIVEDNKKKTRQNYNNLFDFELATLLADEENELIEETKKDIEIEIPNPQTGQIERQKVSVSDVTIIHTEDDTSITFEVIPPEEFLISRDAKSPDPRAARMCGHHTSVTRSDLVEMGYKKKDISKMEMGENETEFSQEKIARNHLVDETNFNEVATSNEAMQLFKVSELYLHADKDGDGIAELLKVFLSGDFVDIEEVDSIPFSAITPVILTHKFHGLSIDDLISDLQDMRTGHLRAIFDNTNQSINGTTYYNENNVNVEDLLVSAPYGIRAVDGIPAQEVMHIQPQGLPPQAYQLLDVIDKLRAERIGDFQSALDPNVLANANNGVVVEMLNEVNAKTEMIARIFAETGVRDMFRDLHEQIRKVGDKELVLKLRGDWVPVNPQEWQERTDFTVKVGLGTKNRQEDLANLNGLMAMQQQFQQIDGGQGQLVTFSHFYNAAKKYVEAIGEVSSDTFFQNPETAQPPPPPQPEPDIIGATMQIEQAKLQQKNEELAIKDQQLQRAEQLDREKAQINAEAMAAKQQIEEFKMQIASIKTEADHMNAQAKLEVMGRAGELDEELKKMTLIFDQRETKAQMELDKYKAELKASTDLMTKQMELAAKAPDLQALDTHITSKMNEIFENVQELGEKVGKPKRIERDENGQIVRVGDREVERDENGRLTGLS